MADAGRTAGGSAAAINGLGAVVTAVATVVFLITKFTEGAWVVVIAVPAFIFLFTRIHRYYQRAGRALGLGDDPGAAAGQARRSWSSRSAGVSRLDPARDLRGAVDQRARHRRHRRDRRRRDQSTGHTDSLRSQWARWDPGVPLRVLHTEYASVAGPIVAFIDELRQQHDEQIVVLIPVVRPDRLRYRLLHNQIDLVLTRALRNRPDIILTRVTMPLQSSDD